MDMEVYPTWRLVHGSAGFSFPAAEFFDVIGTPPPPPEQKWFETGL